MFIRFYRFVLQIITRELIDNVRFTIETLSSLELLLTAVLRLLVWVRRLKKYF